VKNKAQDKWITLLLLLLILGPFALKTYLGSDFEIYPSLNYPAGAHQMKLDSGIVCFYKHSYFTFDTDSTGQIKNKQYIEPRHLIYPVYIQYLGKIKRNNMGLKLNSDSVRFHNTDGIVTSSLDFLGFNKTRPVNNSDISEAKIWYQKNLERFGYQTNNFGIELVELKLHVTTGDTLAYTKLSEDLYAL